MTFYSPAQSTHAHGDMCWGSGRGKKKWVHLSLFDNLGHKKAALKEGTERERERKMDVTRAPNEGWMKGGLEQTMAPEYYSPQASLVRSRPFPK